MSNEQPVLSVRGFAKHFTLHEQGKTVPSAHDVDLDVYAGQLTALIGPTGAGKSSVLKAVYRTYKPQQGELLYRQADDQIIDLARADDHRILALRRGEIGFVTQFLHTLPRQPAIDVVARPLIQQGVPGDEARAHAAELLTALNVPERLWALSPATFSGGERQRVNLARGLAARPRLLLLDEPTASLDPDTTERVIDLLAQLKAEGCALLAIFHQPELVERLADHVVRLTPPPSVNAIEDVA